MTNSNKTLTNVNKRITRKQKHNDRNFDSETDKHINSNMTVENIYWNCFDGMYLDIEKSTKMTFEEVERKHYEENYQEALDITNENYIKSRHKERCKTIDDLLTGAKTAPMETLLYVGDSETTVDTTTLLQIFEQFAEQLNEYDNLCLLDMALHTDETTPHIHMRYIIDYEDDKGLIRINQNKGLEQMGIELPEPEEKISKNNNRMMTMTQIMRDTLIDICKSHNINIVKSDRMGGQSLDDYKRDKDIEKKKQAQLKQAEAKKQQAEAEAKKIIEEAQAKKQQAEAEAKKIIEEAQAKKKKADSEADNASEEARRFQAQAKRAKAEADEARKDADIFKAEKQAAKAEAKAKQKKAEAELRSIQRELESCRKELEEITKPTAREEEYKGIIGEGTLDDLLK